MKMVNLDLGREVPGSYWIRISESEAHFLIEHLRRLLDRSPGPESQLELELPEVPDPDGRALSRLTLYRYERSTITSDNWTPTVREFMQTPHYEDFTGQIFLK